MQSCTQISTTQQYFMLNVNSDSFSIQKFIICLHPSPKEHSAKWQEKILHVQLRSCSLTSLENDENLHPYKHHVKAWPHSERSAAWSDLLLRNLDKADVEILAQKGPRRLLGSGPRACRKPCHESHPRSILKLTRGFVLPLLLFWKLFNLTLKLLFIFAPTNFHAIRVN